MIFKFLENKIKGYMIKRMKKNVSKNRILTYNDWMGLNIFFDGFYEKDELSLIVKSLGDNVKTGILIDVGANIGNHTIFFSKFFKHVYSFEPQKKIYNILELNTSDIRNVTINNFGIGEKSDTITFKIPFSNPGMASQFQKSEDSYEEIVEINNYDDKFYDKKISMVKIDTEGNELSVLKGMKKSLIKYSPILCIEINQVIEKRKLLLSFLKHLGYNKFYVSEKYLFPFNVSGFHYFFGNPRKLREIQIDNILNTKYQYNIVIFIKESSDYKLSI